MKRRLSFLLLSILFAVPALAFTDQDRTLIEATARNDIEAARRLIAAAEKDAIGRAAAALIPNDASVFINIGTTTEAVSQALLDRPLAVVDMRLPDRLVVRPQVAPSATPPPGKKA